MLECFLRTKKSQLVVAVGLSCCAINGCTESIWELTSDSVLPKGITLPPGLTRADVMVVRAYMGPTRQGVDDIKVALLYANKYKKLAEVRGKIFLSGKYVIHCAVIPQSSVTLNIRCCGQSQP